MGDVLSLLTNRMTAEEMVQLAIGYLPMVLGVVLSAILVVRRIGADSVLMIVGIMLMLASSILFRLVWNSLTEGDEFGSRDFALIQFVQSVRSFTSATAQTLFAVGVLLLVQRHVRGDTPEQLGDLRNDPRAAHAFADQLERLYRNMVLHFVLMLVSLFVGFFAFLVQLGFRSNELGEWGLMLGALGVVVFGVLFAVSWCKLHYRHWRVAIELSGFNEFSAGQAVGFLFIPLFNLYWMFRSYVTLSELIYQAGRNAKYGGRTPLVNPDSARTLCVINLFTLVPYLGALASIINIFIWFNVHARHRKAVTFMLRAQAQNQLPIPPNA
jgi:hypothetical protein